MKINLNISPARRGKSDIYLFFSIILLQILFFSSMITVLPASPRADVSLASARNRHVLHCLRKIVRTGMRTGMSSAKKMTQYDLKYILLEVILPSIGLM